MNKQLRLTSEFINSPLYKMSVGFDRMFEQFSDQTFTNGATGYPPFNVTKVTKEDADPAYEIIMAIAGFREDDIDIVVEDQTLKVSGRSGVLAEEAGTEVEYIHKGIAERNFERKFRLAQHVEVESASLKDGMLKIRLFLNIPEEQKPKKIKIN